MRNYTRISLITIVLFLFFQSPLFAKRIGLVFGSDYKGNRAGIPLLESCEKDARLIEESLKKNGRFDYIKVFLGPQVTAVNMKNALKEVAGIAKKEDTVMIYFSGHGTVQKDSQAPNGMRNYLVMFDRPHVSDKNLDVWLTGIRSNQTVWIFDACYTGGIVNKGRRGTGSVPVNSNGGRVIQNGNDSVYFEEKTLVSSASANETAWEIDELGHGLFTYWFAKSLEPVNGDLNRDSVVTLLEAFEWASKRVREDARRSRRSQNPQIVGSPSGIFLAGNFRPRSTESMEVKVESVFDAAAEKKEAAVIEEEKAVVVITEEKPVIVQDTVENVAPEADKTQVVDRPSRPAEPVTEKEPPAVVSPSTGKIKIITTILQSRQAGRTVLDAAAVLRAKKLGNEVRKIRVSVSGNVIPAKIEWVDEARLKSVSGESIPLGFYSFNQKRFKNRVAVITVEDVPSGVHEIEIEADDYPLIKERIGVEEKKENSIFSIVSLAGYGSIQGKIFKENFETPVKGQKVWMPTVKGVNQIHTMVTTSDGSFWFLNLPPSDDYQLKASIMESVSLDNENLHVKAGDVLKVDVVLGKNFK